MKKRILLDIDGCIADFFHGIAIFLNDNYGTTLDPDREPSGYNFEDWGGGVENLDVVEATNRWISEGGYGKLPSYPGVKELYDELSKTHDVYIVTARVGDFGGNLDLGLQDQIKKETTDWLKHNGIECDKVFFNHDKIDFCIRNGIYIIIEDKLSTALSAAKNGIDTILIDRAWNRSPSRYRIHRVYTYDEVLKTLNKLSGV